MPNRSLRSMPRPVKRRLLLAARLNRSEAWSGLRSVLSGVMLAFMLQAGISVMKNFPLL